MAIDRILERLLKLHPKLIDLSLSRLKKLLDSLGNPEENLPPIIHVAGTNGKGSTVATLAAIYKSAGYGVHIYTSPHLVRFTERIVVSGSEISKNYLEELLIECEDANNGESITFFEITTAAAMLAFSRNPADLLLLEVGLGGRFDATNVIETPTLSVITPVSMDHQDFLGKTIDEIAFEKAGILKPSVPAIIGPQTNKALNVIKRRALELGSSAYIFGEDWNISPANNQLIFKMGSKSSIVPRPNLLGDHQIQNAGCALASVKLLNGQFPVSPQEIDMGLVSINWPARLQKLKEGNLIENLLEDVEIWIDGGHNQDAAKAIASTLRDWRTASPEISIHMVFGALNNRCPQNFLQYFTNVIDTIRAVDIPGETNALSALEIETAARECGLKAYPAKGISPAITDIISNSSGKRRILICGSLYLAGAVLRENNYLQD
jgi:dihydrofolate synthase/folylpolyglutamate synthase